MNSPNRPKRRFMLGMGALLLPVSGLLFFVVTMQRARSRTNINGNECVLTRGTEISYWGQPFRQQLNVFDLQTAAETTYTIHSDTPSKVFNRGRSLAYWDVAGKLHVVSRGVDRVVYELNRELTAESAWRSRTGLYGSLSVEDGIVFSLPDGNLLHWNRRTNKSQLLTDEQPEVLYRYWDGGTTFACITRADVMHVYQLQRDGLKSLGQTEELPSSVIFADGAKYLQPRPVESRWAIMDTKTNEILAMLPEIDGVWGWRARGDTLIAVFGHESTKGRLSIDSVQQFDPTTLQPLHKEIDVRADELNHFEFDRDGDVLFAIDRTGVVHLIDFTRQRTTRFTAPDGFEWWWPLRVAALAIACLWWLVWSLVLRRDQRSYQPLIDIAIVHALLFVCFGARLHAHMNGPMWNHSLHSWESVIFLGTGASFIGWFSMWIVFGSQHWGLRVGAVAIAFTLAIGFVIVIWDVDAVSFDAALARAESLIGVVAHVAVVLVSLWLLWCCGFRLRHRATPRTRSGTLSLGGFRFST
ncbi:MAG: hypothetical protein AAFU85_12420 [Planctomycetota bacterium]